MPVFDYSFTIQAPLEAVAAFYGRPSALRRVTPPPAFVQFHHVEPVMREGAISDFTLWFGPIPTRWTVAHRHVEALQGFTDSQQRGPLKRWEHTHRFISEGENRTRVSDHIEYEHVEGLRGVLTRVVFSRLALWSVFTYRKFVTRLLTKGKI